jgi:CheY-like chemotaxis protein
LNINILHIDDDSCFLNLSKILLETLSNHYQVDSLENPEKTLLHLDTTTKDYDVIISDFAMPVLNGFELSKLIKQNGYSNIPFIILSGHSKNDLENKATSYEIDGIIEKKIPCMNSYQKLHLMIQEIVLKLNLTHINSIVNKWSKVVVSE